MRKIKFRAKDFANKEWTYGAYNSSSPDYLFDTFPKRFTAEVIVPETVGEYTEMLDTNNKNIWEDDILENQQQDNDLYKRCRVGRRNGMWVVNYRDGGFVSLWWALENCKLAIVGNAFDNPDLLEGWINNART